MLILFVGKSRILFTKQYVIFPIDVETKIERMRTHAVEIQHKYILSVFILCRLFVYRQSI